MNYAVDYIDAIAGHYYMVTADHTGQNFFENQLIKKDCVFCKYGKETDLKGFFYKPVKFVGFDPENEKLAIFYLGSEYTLYSKVLYYEDILILNENRIFKMYSARAGRDFNYINNKWK
jgi:hypothetical protein